ncbi:AEC family transporter [Salinibacterium sp. dk2585]|uniref:AEC family transporter n=1 Tax=unclassified Salinibacterium TaxID=2632331 RepID=UPI0011C24D65|nr:MULTISPECIES: AEC family transporter [unclassified Salinibacterium]QEE60306.1 AEC family transporter [Salinibacterium sp. dk2585]TXK55378.1 AEC family transporter [Salinibacterium sp. dk5596]
MAGVLVGFAIIAAIIATGYVIGRIRLLGPHAPLVLARLVYFVLAPSLLFTILGTTPVERLFSSELAIAAGAAFVAMTAFALVSRFVWRRPAPEVVIGSLSAGYVNANNIGIPVSLYVLGDAAASAPVILLQLLVLAPVGLALLDMTTSGRRSFLATVTQPLKNPILIGSAAGVLVSVAGIEIPAPVMEPFLIVGAAAVPLMLLNYGISLHGQRILQPGSGRRDVLLATSIKLALMPLAAWGLARFVFGLDGHELFVAVGLAALPTAQNVFNYAQLFGRGVIVSRDTILITTVGSLPVLLLIAALLS